MTNIKLFYTQPNKCIIHFIYKIENRFIVISIIEFYEYTQFTVECTEIQVLRHRQYIINENHATSYMNISSI